jgi:hypothetical protein
MKKWTPQKITILADNAPLIKELMLCIDLLNYYLCHLKIGMVFGKVILFCISFDK